MACPLCGETRELDAVRVIGPLSVLLGHDGDLARPDDAELRIVVPDSGRGLGMIELGRVVVNLRVVLEGEVALRTAFRDVQHLPVTRSELHAEPAPVSGRVGPQVDDDVENGAGCAADDLHLDVRWCLEVESSERSPAMA